MLDRRAMMLAALALAAPRPISAQTLPRIDLWPKGPPGGGGPSGSLVIDGTGNISNVVSPALEVFRPTRPNGACVLVAAGGGYVQIAQANEGYPAARWLADHGITAFVLTYRLPGEGWRSGTLAPLQDAQRAMRVIRARARAEGLDPRRIGVLGFSAGGHLMGLTATRPDLVSYRGSTATDRLSSRPDFAALLYPVVTLESPFDHEATRRELLGNQPTQILEEQWSVQTGVRRGCPPMFLAAAEDDPVTYPANTRMLAAACRQAGVPVELHSFPIGGHGFGLGKPGTPAAAWPDLWLQWLARLEMIPRSPALSQARRSTP